MSKRKRIRWAALVVLIVPLSCATPPRRDAAHRATIEKSGHWVQDAQLRSLMADLDREVAVSWPQEVEEEYMATSSSAAHQLEEACWLADALGRAADKIPATIQHVDLSKDERLEFLKYVDELRFKAQLLEKSAAAADVNSMRRVLRSLDHTCNACHTRFRVVAGPIP